jgi:DNA polymerase-3 subunit beta
MKIIVKKQAFENAIVSLQAFLERKDFSHITSHIYFEANQDGLTLKATDNEIGLSIRIDDFILDEEGKTTCNGKKILDIIRILKDDEIIINSENDTLHIKQNRSNYKLPIFNADEYPVFPGYQDLPKVNIDSLKLISSFKKVMPAIDTNNPKFELNGALIDIKTYGINIVGTDTKRLGVIRIDNETNQTTAIIVPKKAIQEIQKLFINQVDIFFDSTNFIIKSDNHYFFTKVINGKFPDYERIIPKELKHNIVLSKEMMIGAIKQVNIISAEIRMRFNPGSIYFESINDENFEAKTEFEAATNIEESFEIAVNSRYIIDFLSQIDSREFTMSFNEPNTPFQLKSESFLTIIMPIAL